jgi:hypothetical protein
VTIKAIDPWVNIDVLGGAPPPKYLERVKEDYLEKYVYENAHGLFFSGRDPRSASAG